MVSRYVNEEGPPIDSRFDGGEPFPVSPDAAGISLDTALHDFGPAAIDDLMASGVIVVTLLLLAAAWAGKHVICEKPLANTVADCNAMLAACRTNRVRLSVGYRLQFEPHYDELKRLARGEQWGPFTRLSGGFSFVMKQAQWRAERKLAGVAEEEVQAHRGNDEDAGRDEDVENVVVGHP